MINADRKGRYHTKRSGDGSAFGAAITASGARLGVHIYSIRKLLVNSRLAAVIRFLIFKGKNETLILTTDNFRIY